MSRFIFELSDENREALEGYRIRWGLRSLSAAIQHMIGVAASDKMLIAPDDASIADILRHETNMPIRSLSPAPIPIGPPERKPGSLLKKK